MYVRILGPLALLALASCSQSMASTSESTSAERVEDAQNSSDIVRFSEECEPWDDWDKPAKPFQIYGNTYYVGTCGISAILVAGDEGHVLIDSGTEAGAQIILDNVRSLGFDPADIKVVAYSHEHFDHVGGHAKIVEATGAKVVASDEARAVFETGVVTENDPQSGMHDPMSPVPVFSALGSGRSVYLGRLRLLPFATPGHSPGALSWRWHICSRDRAGRPCKTIVYADSLSPVSRDDYKFSDHPEYVAKFRAGIEKIRRIKCDILLTPHPSHSRMIQRAARGTMEGGMTCAEYADSKTAALDARLAKEKAE